MMLQIDMHPEYIKMLAEDLTDKYSHETVEDLVYCLKQGRLGNYGKTYNKLNMVVISEWMELHLEHKAKEREKLLKQKYQTSKEPLAVVDYELYKQRIAEKTKKVSKPDAKDLSEYIEKVCEALNVDLKELYSDSRKQEVVDARDCIKNYQKTYLKMNRRQIQEHWSCKE